MNNFILCILYVCIFQATKTYAEYKTSSPFLAFKSSEKLHSEIQFIAPNEYNFTDLNKLLNKKHGVLITVGTFRALHSASLSNFDEVYLLDSNKVVNDFNISHLSSIANSPTREEYLNHLFQSDNAAKIIQDAYDKKVSFKKLSDFLNSSIISSDDPRAFSSQFPFSDFYQYRLLDFIMNPDLFKNSFLGSDKLYNHLRALILREKIKVLPGSLTGTKSIKWLAKTLHEKKLVVSVLDISNAEEYIKGNKEQINFLLNLEALPTNDNTKLIKTKSQQMVGSNYSWWSWLYISANLNEFIRSKRQYIEFWFKVPRKTNLRNATSLKASCEFFY